MTATSRVVLSWMAAGVLAADAFAFSPQSEVSPDQWARMALAGCSAAAERLRGADEELERQLASRPVSREQAAFLTRETAARATSDKKRRIAAIARLHALLFGGNARFPNAETESSDSFLDVLRRLLGGEDVCAIEAIEGTVVLGLFGVPLNADAAGRLRSDREFMAIEAFFRANRDRGDSLEQVFERMRPAAPDDLLARVQAVAREALRRRRNATSNDGGIPSDLEQSLRQFLEFITYGAEPVRIQYYLHAKVDAVEGALGTTLPDGAHERLFSRVEDTLYNSVDRMRRLREMPPSVILAALEPILDRWFRTSAVPAVRNVLEDEPFAAYWFYVQSGGVASPGPVFSGSRVAVTDPAFSLSELERLPLAKALDRLDTLRVPASFQQHHLDLESAFTTRTLSRDEVLAQLDRSQVPATIVARLRDFILAEAQSSRVSSIDFYSQLIRDSNRIRGRVDRQLISAAVDVVCTVKADRLKEHIQSVLDAEPAPDPRLATYLNTSAALMLELERRQTTESAFQQGTAGAAVGWLLSRFFIGGRVPIELWAPDGVNGAEFGELVDELTPKNARSGNDYRGKPVGDIDLVHDGQEYHAALITVIETARQFINISSFDWKTDTGGRDIAYRLMAKKLGIDGPAYADFLSTFERGLPIDPARPEVVPFYDIPTTRMKDLLTRHFLLTSDREEVVRARDAAREAGASLECATVMTCGDLEGLLRQTGTRYDPRRSSPAYDRAWQAYQQIETLFSDRPLALKDVRPKPALGDYIEDPDALRRLVRRLGLRRADRPEESFPINIITDAKQNLFNIRMGERSEVFPYVFMEPIRDVHFMLMEFDIRVVLWKGPMEMPWNIGPVPIPGRKVLGKIPMPLIPWPWLNAVPGFQWVGPCASMFLQYLLASDVRIWWAAVTHTKSWSNESMALESGMGMGSKYFNQFDTHKTWHDMGVLVQGAPVDDVNDHFVQVFNEARVNNGGLPASRGVKIRALRHEDYRAVEHPVARSDQARAWLLTTHPEQGDSNYRGVYVAALAAARRNIYIENSFFSDPLVARMLMHKAREFRGRVNCEGLTDPECAARTRDAVQIYLVLPDSSDKPVVDAVGAADFHEMLHLGIKVHRWNPDEGWSASRMLHSKVWLIDYEPGRGGLAYVGAANATQRSHLADNEAGILSNDPAFARQVYERIFMRDITEDSRVESAENFHIVRNANPVVRASRWLRRLLVELFWFI